MEAFSPEGGFPLGKMSGDFATKFIWACAFLFVYSLARKIFLFIIVKMDYLIRDEKIRNNQQANKQTSQQANTFQSLLYQQIHFIQIKSKVAANSMSNIHL